MQIMRAGHRPELRRLQPGEQLTRQGELDTKLFLLLDGVLRADVDGAPVAELGPGAVVGERALFQDGRRTATLTATTRCLIAVADPSALNREALAELSLAHHREDSIET
jgi:CRP-like cAMP-binding protein